MPTDATEAQSNASRAGVSTTLSVAMIVSPLTVVEGGPGAANTRFRRFTGLSPILWKAIAWIATASCRSEEHTSELQSLMRISYAAFCLKKKKHYKSILTHSPIK